MRKILVYLLLSFILVAPIATITAVLIVNSGKVSYSYPENYSNDLSGLETYNLTKGSIKEEIKAYGLLTSDILETITVYRKDESKTNLLCEVGDFFNKGDVVCTSDGVDYSVDFDCLVLDVAEYYNSIVITIQSIEVNTVQARLPISNYVYAENSSIAFQLGGNEYYDILFSGAEKYANEDGASFYAYYNLDGKGLLFGSSVELIVATGRMVDNVLILPEKYLFITDDGRYYVQVFSSDTIKKVYVDLGVFGDGMVQIITESEGDLTVGNTMIANSLNIFNEDTHA